ncbi:helix-turn-helix transcriptional regulator [Parageobacillus toebii]
MYENRRKKKLGLTQEEIAERCGAARQTINCIEKDKYDPAFELVRSNRFG